LTGGIAISGLLRSRRGGFGGLAGLLRSLAPGGRTLTSSRRYEKDTTFERIFQRNAEKGV
jgi:hypothetical protein